MINSTAFPFVAKPDAKILILGTMPGQKSLEENQYYAHPRNSFWPIMFKLLKTDSDLSYDDRKKLLIRNNIALWDVLKSCYREGSLDSDIEQSSIETNDFKRFFSIHKRVAVVFFNGAKAEQLFKKNSLKKLKHAQQELYFFRLPSTSSAHAARTFEQKLLQWAVIKHYL
jgi:TDG/mug DNA glycosylase family protein|tara:strand:+ start:70 stop:579 length:510 start_codon:yes stop_codon:yes gene_type:complete